MLPPAPRVPALAEEVAAAHACLRAIEGRVSALSADCASSAAAAAGAEKAAVSLVATLRAGTGTPGTRTLALAGHDELPAPAAGMPPAYLGGALHFVGGMAVGALLFMLRNKK